MDRHGSLKQTHHPKTLYSTNDHRRIKKDSKRHASRISRHRFKAELNSHVNSLKEG